MQFSFDNSDLSINDQNALIEDLINNIRPENVIDSYSGFCFWGSLCY